MRRGRWGIVTDEPVLFGGKGFFPRVAADTTRRRCLPSLSPVNGDGEMGDRGPVLRKGQEPTTTKPFPMA